MQFGFRKTHFFVTFIKLIFYTAIFYYRIVNISTQFFLYSQTLRDIDYGKELFLPRNKIIAKKNAAQINERH